MSDSDRFRNLERDVPACSFSSGACSITLYGSVNYGFVVTAKILPVNCQNFVIYDHFAVNYDEKSFME